MMIRMPVLMAFPYPGYQGEMHAETPSPGPSPSPGPEPTPPEPTPPTPAPDPGGPPEDPVPQI
jgi:hypothetical protein